jgi:hypothetical protein
MAFLAGYPAPPGIGTQMATQGTICKSHGSGSMMHSPSLRQPFRMNGSASSADSSSVPSEATLRCRRERVCTDIPAGPSRRTRRRSRSFSWR